MNASITDIARGHFARRYKQLQNNTQFTRFIKRPTNFQQTSSN